MTSQQTKAAIVLFESGHFDTADIAELLAVSEAAVARTLQASRDVIIELYRDQKAGAR